MNKARLRAHSSGAGVGEKSSKVKIRTDNHLEQARQRIRQLRRETQERYESFQVSHKLIELKNLLQVSELMVACAVQRKESRGLHYTLDYPNQLKHSGPTILGPRSNL